jgi:hypothetical protein
MDRKRFLIAAGIASGILLWVFSASIFLLVVRPRLQAQGAAQPAQELAYCGGDPEALCVVSFGADHNGHMLINFMLPYPSYPRFHLKVLSAGSTGEYVCRVVEAIPGGAYCSGPRTPLGEAVVIEVYSVSNALLARGVFVVSSIGLPTPVSVSQTPVIKTTVPPAESDEIGTQTMDGNQSTPTSTETATPAPDSYP